MMQVQQKRQSKELCEPNQAAKTKTRRGWAHPEFHLSPACEAVGDLGQYTARITKKHGPRPGLSIEGGHGLLGQGGERFRRQNRRFLSADGGLSRRCSIGL